MSISDFCVLAVIAAILGLAAWYVVRSKKKGRKCIGCPDGGNCCGDCSSCKHE